MKKPYPLQWPEGWPRTKTSRRRRARFDTGLHDAARGIVDNLRMMQARQVVITTDMPARSDGLPYATAREPEDVGVAVWWVDEHGNERVIACDVWEKVGDNLHAIELSLAALRGLDRWGASEVVKRAFAGFAALPPGGDSPPRRSWREVLGAEGLESFPPEDQWVMVKALHRSRMEAAHPDAGGTTEQALELNAALDEAKLELQPSR